MVILGLGSNVGDRLSHLRKALRAIREEKDLTVQQVSPLYLSDALLPDHAPSDWDRPHLNFAIRCETPLEPLALLHILKNIEWSIGRKPEVRHWGPRILDIDILAWEDFTLASEALTVPHMNLIERPFALWPLADIAPLWRFPLSGPYQGKTAAELVEKWGSRFTREAPLRTVQLNQRLENPQLMGILNVTPDSFSDGGQFVQVDVAVQHALELVKAGAEIIDIGAESTSPRAQALTAQEEWTRLEPVLKAIALIKKDFLLPPLISIDTRHAEVAEKALAYSIDWINDVSGLDHVRMREIVREAKITCVIMHHLMLPERRDCVLPRDQDPIQALLAWGQQRLALLLEFGLTQDQLIFDPGIGFGKMAEQSLEVIKHIPAFKQLGTKILIGHSRKTFLSLFSKEPFANRDIETATLSLYLAQQGVDYLRIHQPETTARALKVMDLMGGEN
ncbi:MAG: dihydropteroate synthase [Gammaproteobacteria bacterium]|nr:dihydropteroate synthase [Gammaproteobacteria bacterium]